jgi:hypothetical protein
VQEKIKEVASVLKGEVGKIAHNKALEKRWIQKKYLAKPKLISEN